MVFVFVFKNDALWKDALLRMFGISPGPKVPTDGKPHNVSMLWVNSYINVAMMRQLLTTLGFLTGLRQQQCNAVQGRSRSERVHLQEGLDHKAYTYTSGSI